MVAPSKWNECSERTICATRRTATRNVETLTCERKALHNLSVAAIDNNRTREL